jgi:DUF4097 and DUF4098 domain-containing protein YvlB
LGDDQDFGRDRRDGRLKLSAASSDVSARGTKGGLEIEAGAGSIHAEQLEGRVSLDTGSGDVTLLDQRGVTLTIGTRSGSVTGSGVAAPELTIDTGQLRRADPSAQARRGEPQGPDR